MSPAAQPEATRYTYRVTWSAEDGEFVANCAEFPSLSWLAPSPREALEGLQDMLRDVTQDLEKQGERVPQPSAERWPG